MIDGRNHGEVILGAHWRAFWSIMRPLESILGLLVTCSRLCGEHVDLCRMRAQRRQNPKET